MSYINENRTLNAQPVASQSTDAPLSSNADPYSVVPYAMEKRIEKRGRASYATTLSWQELTKKHVAEAVQIRTGQVSNTAPRDLMTR